MSPGVLWVFKGVALTRPRFVYETTSLFEWKQWLDKSHVALNQWPVLKRCNCLFTAGSKSFLASPSTVHPYKCHADSGCLAAAVLELFPLWGFFCFVLFYEWWATKSASFYWSGNKKHYQSLLQKGSAEGIWDSAECFMLRRHRRNAGCWSDEF